MENNQLDLTYKDVDLLIESLYKKIVEKGITPRSVYGIPRGGVYPAYALSRKFNCPLITDPSEATHLSGLQPILVVDDILDSGKTMQKIQIGGTIHKAALITKQEGVPEGPLSAQYVEPGKWVNFPWEMKGTAPSEGIEDNIVRILQYIGEDPGREGLLETPKRVQKAYGELFAGYKQDPQATLAKEFSTTYDQMVILKDIEFFSFCEHHMLPFFGKASVAYIPIKKVVGISKLARLVDIYARRLQIQEQMTDQIAGDIEKYLKPEGVAVTITAKHFCMVTRGVQKQNSVMTTTSLRGAFKNNPETRAEFFSRI